MGVFTLGHFMHVHCYLTAQKWYKSDLLFLFYLQMQRSTKDTNAFSTIFLHIILEAKSYSKKIEKKSKEKNVKWKYKPYCKM